MSSFLFPGWQWDDKDRPTFKDIHNALEHMFEKTSISDGTVYSYNDGKHSQNDAYI